MKIFREFCGQTVKIELTEEEIEKAHYEHEDKCDLEDCKTCFCEVYQYEPWLKALLDSGDKFAQILEQMRILYRKYMDKYDESWWQAGHDAAKHPLVVEMIYEFKKGESK